MESTWGAVSRPEGGVNQGGTCPCLQALYLLLSPQDPASSLHPRNLALVFHPVPHWIK